MLTLNLVHISVLVLSLTLTLILVLDLALIFNSFIIAVTAVLLCLTVVSAP